MDVLARMVQRGPFNLFVGAGVSKAPPSSAPLWLEMCDGFLDAVFGAMIAQGWSLSPPYEFTADRQALQRFRFKPEAFWHLVEERGGAGVPVQLFGCLGGGAPNLNHRVFARLLASGVVHAVVTTNFDEHIEQAMPDSKHVIVAEADAADLKDADSKGGWLFKIHGTLSFPESIGYTLGNTERLPAWKARSLERCLRGLPLLIAGYSGADNDVFPVLRRLVAELPEVVIVRHPGRTQPEPVEALSENGRRVSIVEADISVAVHAWAEHAVAQGTLPAAVLIDERAESPSFSAVCAETIPQIPLPALPHIVSKLFSFAHDVGASCRYGWVASDACEDEQDASDIGRAFHGEVLVSLAMNVAAAGDAQLSQYLFERAAEKSGAPQSVLLRMNLERAHAILRHQPLSAEDEREAALIIEGTHGVLRERPPSWSRFRSCWLLGRLRSVQGRFEEAVQAYTEASQLSPAIREELGRVEIGSFLLDCGGPCSSSRYLATTMCMRAASRPPFGIWTRRQWRPSPLVITAPVPGRT